MSFSMFPEGTTLPPLVPGTENRLALPRPGTPLVCVVAPRSTDLYNVGLDGEQCSKDVLIRGQFHVVPQVGHQYVVSGGDVRELEAWTPFHAFRLDGPPSWQDPVWPVMQQVWGAEVEALTLQRVLPAFVVGQIADDPALAHEWLETTDGHWLTTPGAWLIREMSGRGPRVVPTLHMGREFRGISSSKPAQHFEMIEA